MTVTWAACLSCAPGQEVDSPPHPLDVAVSFSAIDNHPWRADEPLQVVHAPPIELPQTLVRKIKRPTHGLIDARIDTTGAVRRVYFDGASTPVALEKPIRDALLNWKFAPIRYGGEARNTEIKLRFDIEPAAQAVDEASAGLQPPRRLYAVHPAPLAEFFASSDDIVPVSGVVMPAVPPRPHIITTTSRSPAGEQQVRVVHVPSPTYSNPLWIEIPGRTMLTWMNATVVVSFQIDESGVPQNARVLESSCPLLEPEALAAIPFWRYQPAQRDGRAVACGFEEIIVFPSETESALPSFIRPISRSRPAGKKFKPPQFVVFVPPIYPIAAARDRKEGDASVEVQLTAEGRITEVTVTKAKDPSFGEALRAAVFECRFSPAHAGTEAVESRFLVQANFGSTGRQRLLERKHIPAVNLRYRGETPPVAVDDLDRPPRLISGRAPSFHGSPTEAGEPASVDLELIVDHRGRVKEPVVISEANADFDYTAVQSVAAWLFEPPVKKGEPTPARVRLRLRADATEFIR